ncbi:hypothetical protein CRUP_025394 [Coryphaenoides rupestris]|nr:hypothetical protein CRUP_025394 [Coryphaenoides rupestris]
MGLNACSEDEPGEWGGDWTGIRAAGPDPGGLHGQRAHTVTRVMSRNMPPVDKMMYSELRPKRQRDALGIIQRTDAVAPTTGLVPSSWEQWRLKNSLYSSTEDAIIWTNGLDTGTENHKGARRQKCWTRGWLWDPPSTVSSMACSPVKLSSVMEISTS